MNKLTPNDVLRHYDVGGEKCPLYFVEHEDSWEQFRQDLTDYIMEEEEYSGKTKIFYRRIIMLAYKFDTQL